MLESKKACLAYLKELLEWKQRLFTELRNFCLARSYCILRFAILISNKKYRKFVFSDISDKLELVCQSSLNRAEFLNSLSHIKTENLN